MMEKPTNLARLCACPRDSVIPVVLAGLCLLLGMGCSEEEPPAVSVLSSSSGGDDTLGSGGSDISNPPVSGGGTGGSGGVEVGGGEAQGGTSGNGGANKAGSVGPFDGHKVYFQGTFTNQGPNDLLAFADPLSPNRGIVGLWIHDGNYKIRGSDGGIVYRAEYGTLREFHCDGRCVLTKGINGSDLDKQYPESTVDNDIVIPTAGCPDNKVQDFHYSPSGDLYYLCNLKWHDASGGVIQQKWRDTNGEVIEIVNPNILAVHDFGLILTSGSFSVAIRDTSDSAMPPVIAEVSSSQDIQNVRAVDDGFLIVMDPPSSGHRELWHLGFNSIMAKLGDFPPPPQGIHREAYDSIDGDGQLWVKGRRAGKDGVSQNVIYRSGVADDEAEIVFDEAEKPYVGLHNSSLFTGNGGRRFSRSLDAPNAEQGIQDTRIASDVFDHKKVYGFGTARAGILGGGIVIYSSGAPDINVMGIGLLARTPQIDPISGRMYYRAADNTIREFHCDGWCQFVAYEPYPEDVISNDPVRPAVGCTDDKVRTFYFSPNGSFYYSCLDEDSWRGENGKVILTGEGLANEAGGHDGGRLLTTYQDELWVITPTNSSPDVPNQTAVAGGLGEAEIVVTRAVNDGWLIVSQSTDESRTRTLLRVSLDGKLETIGIYPPSPFDTGTRISPSALDSKGDLWRIGLADGDQARLLLRSVIGESESEAVIRLDSESPYLLRSFGTLFTGSSWPNGL